MSSTTTKSRRRDWWGWWVFGALLVALGTGGGIFWLLQVKLAATPSVYQNARSAVTLTGIAGAAVLAAVALLRLRATDREHQLSRDRHKLEQAKHDQAIADAQRARDDRATDLETARKQREEDTTRADISALRARYTTAAEQLGHSSPAIRLAGVFAMAALADDWVARGNHTEVQTCIDVLCSIIRTPPPADLADHEQRADLEVRQTITRTIASHLQGGASPGWHDRDFDFTGATFNGTHSFAHAEFTGGRVVFDGARFTGGRVSFAQATFTGGRVSFAQATFTSGRVSFDRAEFASYSVSFARAEFTGDQVSFNSAKFTGDRVSFAAARFTGGRVVIDRAQFTGGYVFFTGAEFTGGQVSFDQATLASDRVSFDRALFTDGQVSFNSATFTDSRASFSHATFTGGQVSFDRAQFTGGHVSFRYALFTGGQVSFAAAHGEGANWAVTSSWQYPGVVDGDWASKPPEWWPIPTRRMLPAKQERTPPP